MGLCILELGAGKMGMRFAAGSLGIRQRRTYQARRLGREGGAIRGAASRCDRHLPRVQFPPRTSPGRSQLIGRMRCRRCRGLSLHLGLFTFEAKPEGCREPSGGDLYLRGGPPSKDGGRVTIPISPQWGEFSPSRPCAFSANTTAAASASSTSPSRTFIPSLSNYPSKSKKKEEKRRKK